MTFRFFRNKPQMLRYGNECRIAAAPVQAIKARQDNQGVARASSPPELYAVGNAGELVQGNFG
jgi:hypothetical protein